MRRRSQNTDSGRADLLIHVSLGIAALVAVLVSLRTAFELAANLDRVAERLYTHSAAPGSATENSDRISHTNVARVEFRRRKPGDTPRAGLPIEPEGVCQTNWPGS